MLLSHTPHPKTTSAMPGLARVFSMALKTGLALLITSVIGAGLAIRSNAVPPFDWQLTPDGQHILAIHHGPVCRAMPGLSDGVCADYVADLREFTITYRTPHTNWLLVSALLPER